MGIDQKIRSLHCGVIAGLNFKDLNGERVMFIHDSPYELEDILCRWVMTQPDDEQASMLRYDALNRPALTETGWSDFVRWMTATLHAEQAK